MASSEPLPRKIWSSGTPLILLTCFFSSSCSGSGYRLYGSLYGFSLASRKTRAFLPANSVRAQLYGAKFQMFSRHKSFKSFILLNYFRLLTLNLMALACASNCSFSAIVTTASPMLRIPSSVRCWKVILRL